ncbi:MAG: hypothetical protein ACOYNC_04540 [Bacteroidales bacterium]
MTDAEQNITKARTLRMKAEEQLNNEQLDIKVTSQEYDDKRLLHELRVHQIELEMQNAELQQANETAEAALKRYTMLYDFAPMGYFTLDKEGNICELNFTGAEMLQDRRFALINSNFKLFVSENSRLVFNDFLNRVFLGFGKESCEVMLGYDKTPLCRVYMDGVVTGHDCRCLLSVVEARGLQ